MINQPTNEVGTLEGLIKELTTKKEALENTVTVLGTEVINLRKAVDAEKYTISEAVKEKEDIERQINDLNTTIDLKKRQYDIVINNTDEANKELAKVREESLMITEEQKNEDERLSILRVELTKKDAEVTKTIDDYAERATSLARKEAKLEANSKALKDAIKSCLTPD